MGWCVGAVLAKTDGVMREDVERVRGLQRTHAEGGAAVVREGEEGAAEGNEPAVRGDPVDGGHHAELADAEVDVAALGVDVEAGGILEDGLGGAGQVGRAAEQLRHDLGIIAFITTCPALRVATGFASGPAREDGNGLLPALGRSSWMLGDASVLGAELRISLFVLGKLRLPLRACSFLPLVLALAPLGFAASSGT